MKVVLILGLMVVCIRGFGQTEVESNQALAEVTPVGINSLLYLVPEDSTKIEIGQRLSRNEQSVKYAGVKVLSAIVDTRNTYLQAVHGLAPNLEFGGSIDVLGTKSTEIKYGQASTKNGTSQTTKDSGASNPVFGLRYRLGESQEKSYFLTGHYRPSVTKSKTGTTKSDGNIAEAQTAAIVSLEVVKKIKNSEVRGQVRKGQYFSGTSENAETGDETTYGAYGTFNLVGEYRKHVNDQLYVGASLEFSTQDGMSFEYKSGKEEYDSIAMTSFKILGGYLIDPNLLINASYENLPGASSKIQSGSNRLDFNIDQVQQFVLNVQYLF